jgi:hypothetical protein
MVQTFPFHDFVVISDGTSSAAVFAKGIHAYRAENDGTIALTLRRSVEWLTKPDLPHRAGDAGPLMYVPDARCERTIQHEIAIMVGKAAIDDLTIHQLNSGFQNPPLIVESQGRGKLTEWQFLQENLPLTGLHFYNNRPLARFFNPTGIARVLGKPYQKTDVLGNPESFIKELAAKQILTVEIEQSPPPPGNLSRKQSVAPIAWPEWRVGNNQGQPDPNIITQLEAKMVQLEKQLTQIEAQMNSSGGEQYLLQHRYYILKRELYELRLSAQFNRRKLNPQPNDYLYTADPDIAELGTQLNQLRIKRRIYDYVVEVL